MSHPSGLSSSSGSNSKFDFLPFGASSSHHASKLTRRPQGPCVDVAIVVDDNAVTSSFMVPLKEKYTGDHHAAALALSRHSAFRSMHQAYQAAYGKKKKKAKEDKQITAMCESHYLALVTILEFITLCPADPSPLNIALIPFTSFGLALQHSSSDSQHRAAPASFVTGVAKLPPEFKSFEGKDCGILSSTKRLLNFAYIEWSRLENLPIRVLHVPTLLWFLDHGTLAQLQRRFERLASHHYAVIAPPLSQDENIERKDLLYKALGKYMLPTVFYRLTDESLESVEKRILADLPNPGVYVMKGSYVQRAQGSELDLLFTFILTSCILFLCPLSAGVYSSYGKRNLVLAWQDGKLVVRIWDKAGHSPANETLLECLKNMRDLHQTDILICPYVEGFRQREYRYWTIVQPKLKKHSSNSDFTPLAMIETATRVVDKDVPEQSAVMADVTEPEAAACQRLLIERILPSPYVADLYRVHGITAIRFDLGYDHRHGGGPFLSEIAAAPDGVIYFCVHETNLLDYNAKKMAAVLQRAMPIRQ